MSTKTKNQINSFLSFRIGSEVFAANVRNVLNILEMTKITKVPKASSYMKGVINLRGNVLPIIDSRLKFGLEETEYTTNTCIIVLELHIGNDPITVGAIVDSVNEVLEIDDDNILPPPGIGTNFRSDFLKGMAKKDEGFIMLLDVEKVFATDEVVDIQNITEEISKQTTAEQS
ncbi:MAG: chemotaxis protein CheW [Bacteroidales bacterium]|nr:chemotaxis protein CheW [Bacteroidales bacterium]